MLRVGLTGGIGCGKSMAADMFAKLGVPIIDTDQIAHDLTRPESSVLIQLFNEFGNDIKNPDSSLNRKTLRELVFSDNSKRDALEAILHPLIMHAVQDQLDDLEAPYCIVVIPLLIEKGLQDTVDRILVVDCPETVQRQRVLQRSDMNETLLEQILDSQCGREQRLDIADDIILNQSNDPADLEQLVLQLHQQYTDITNN